MIQIPYIDPDVIHVGTSELRKFNAEQLSNLDENVYVICREEPLAVLMSYDLYMKIQNLYFDLDYAVKKDTEQIS